MLEVRGARNLRRTLKRAGDDLTELKGVHGRVAGVVAGVTRPPRRTGRLAGTVRGAGTAAAAIVRAGFAAVAYAGPIHWGWPARRIRAQTFLSDAATSSEPVWIGVYTSAMERIISKVEGI
jgi:hypothetical protein